MSVWDRYQDSAHTFQQGFEDRFNANFPAIQAYKQSHGGSWEEAFQAVTGEAWPHGRDIALNEGRTGGENVQDPGILPTLAKIGLIGGGGAAALFGIPGLLPGILGGGGGAAAGAAGGMLPSTQIGSGFLPAIGGAASGGSGGVLGALGGIGGTLADHAGNIGKVLTGAAGANAAGRRDDSYADMNAATANNRARVDVGTFNMNAPVTRAQQVARGDLMAQTIPDARFTGSGKDIQFTGGVRPSLFTDDSRNAGDALKREAMQALLTKSDQFQPQLAQPRKAGAGENIAAGVGLGLNIFDVLNGGI